MTKKITIKSDQYEGIKTGWDNFNEDLYQDYLFMRRITNKAPEYIRQLSLIVQNKFKSN